MRTLKILAVIFFDFIDLFIHQRNIIRNIKKDFDKISSYIDVGAHKGTYLDLFMKFYNLDKAYIFEPQPEIFNFLKKKYKKSKKITKINSAVSDVNGFREFRLNLHDLTSSFTKLNHNNLYLKFKAKLFETEIKTIFYKNIKVKTIKLSSFFKKNRIKNIDLLKIDTEGHEFQVLKGLGKEIKKINIILIEFHKPGIYLDYDSKKIHKYLLKNKFVLKKKIKFPLTTFEDRLYIKKTSN